MSRWLTVLFVVMAVILVAVGLLYEGLADGFCEEPGCGDGTTGTTKAFVVSGIALALLSVWAWMLARRR